MLNMSFSKGPYWHDTETTSNADSKFLQCKDILFVKRGATEPFHQSFKQQEEKQVYLHHLHHHHHLWIVNMNLFDQICNMPAIYIYIYLPFFDKFHSSKQTPYRARECMSPVGLINKWSVRDIICELCVLSLLCVVYLPAFMFLPKTNRS